MTVHVTVARDNHALKSLLQNVYRGMRCVARSAILLEHVIGIHIIHFRSQEVAYHRSVALVVDGYGNARFVFWKKYGPMIPNKPKSAPNSDFLGMHLELVYLTWIGIVPNSTILLVHISIHPKMGLIAKDLFDEIWINFQLLQNSISEHMALSMVIYFKFLGQLNFIGVQTQVPTQNSLS